MADKFQLSRRTFLKLAPAAMAAGAGCYPAPKSSLQRRGLAARVGDPLIAYPFTENVIHRPEDGQKIDGVVKSGCSFCPSSCRHHVHIKEGRVYNVYGEPDDPVQRGRLCAKGQSIPQLIYNKHRLLKPMKRVGDKPTSNFEPISWEQAYTEICSKLLEIKGKHGAKAVAAKATGRQTRDTPALQWRFMELFGSPNTTHEGIVCNDGGGVALKMTFGNTGQTNGYGPDPITGTEDLGDSKFVLWLGSNHAETHPVLHGYMQLRRQAVGAQWAVVDPRMTFTGAGANLWIPIKCGTDMAFVYGMIHHVIERGLYDRNFVSGWVLGFSELQSHVLGKGYSPKWAERITGVPEATIREVAERYATTKPAAIITNAGIAHQVNAVDTYRVIAFLAAITGNIGIPGGGANFLHNSPVGLTLPPIKGAEPITEPGLPPHPDYFVESVLTGKPYQIHGIIYAGNMMTQNASNKRTQEALKKLDLFVSLNLFPQEDCYFADYILPTTTFYEVEAVGMRRCDRGIRWNSKVVEPVGESRIDSRIWIEMGQKMAELDKKHPPAYWKENLKAEWLDTRSLWNTVNPANDKTSAGMTADRMEKMSTPLRWPCPTASHPGTSVMYLDKPEWRGIFGGKRFLTPSGKVEIYTKELQGRLEPTGHSAIPVFYTSPENLDGLPTLQYLDEFILSPTVANTAGGNLVHKVKIGVAPGKELEELRKKFPFQFTTGRPNALHFHSITHWAWGLVQQSGDRYIQIHPDVAKQMNVQSGDYIKLETPRGFIEGPAVVWDGIQPNTVFVPMGFGLKQVVRTAMDRRVWDSVNNLTETYYDTLSGQVCYKTQLCAISSHPGLQIYKVGHPAEELGGGSGAGGK